MKNEFSAGTLATMATMATKRLERLRKTAVTEVEKVKPDNKKTDQTPWRQVNCRAYGTTKILMATRPEHCVDEQGEHCGDCELRIVLPTKY